jgi:type II secretory pathway component PulF
MNTYNYTGMDAKGHCVEGHVEAESENDANAVIKGMGYFPTSITAGGTDDRKSRERLSAFMKTVLTVLILAALTGLTWFFVEVRFDIYKKKYGDHMTFSDFLLDGK